jgi:hypothetical protein
MCGACSMYGGEATRIHAFSAVRDVLEGPGIYGRVLLWWSFRNWNGGRGRTDVARAKDRWQTLVNVVMNLRVP